MYELGACVVWGVGSWPFCIAAKCCGREGTPSYYEVCFSSCCAAAEGNSLRRCGASTPPTQSRPRGSLYRVVSVACEDKIYRPRKFPDYMDLSIHGSLARELPKAEGVAFGVAGILSAAGKLPVRRTEEGGFPAADIFSRFHGSFSTRLPRGRDCVGGVLPAVAVTASTARRHR